MPSQLPPPAGSYPGLPLLPIDSAALTQFSEQMDRRLTDLEARFAAVRKHPRVAMRKKWKPPRKPK